MASYNRVILAGNLTRDPEVRTTSTGLTVVNATIANNRKKKNGEEEVAFIDLTIWEKRGEAFARFHKKGDKVFIEGELRMDSWEDKQTGQNRTKLKVSVNNWEFVKSDSGVKSGGNF